MSSLENIKAKIEKLYKTNPNIHINVALVNPRLNIKNDPAVIKGVYPYIFQIEENSSGKPKCHTLQYEDVLINRIEIVEMEKM